MNNIKNFISSELRYPTSTSKKKKRYVTYNCINCNKVTETTYQKGKFNNLCTHCSKGGFTTEDFIKRGREHFGDTYDYSKTNYINKRSPVTIICPVHGEFTQRAQEHLDGHGCNACKFIAKSINQQLPKDVWIERLKCFPLLSFKSLDFELGYHTPVQLLCKIHGEFTSTLGALEINKHVCIKCANTAHQSQSIRPEHVGKMAYVYYVYLPLIDMYKIGVTLDMEERFKQFKDVQLIDSKSLEYTEACKLEHKLMVKLDQHRYKGSQKLIPTGSSELFKTDVRSHIIRALQK